MLLYGILARKTRESFHIKRRKYRITEKDAAETRAEEIRPRVSTKSTPCHRKPAKAGFRWFHQFFVKWRFRAKLPGNAHFTAKN
jgi:hypothetical protein